MMNAPTISAMTAKTGEHDVEEAELLVDRVLVLLGDRLAGDHLVLLAEPGRRRASSAMSACTCSWLTPGLATTLISPNWSIEFARRCASGIVKSVIDAPARLSAVPNFAMPTIVYFRGAFDVSTVTRSPTFRLPLVGGVLVDDDLVGGLRRPAARRCGTG